MFISGNPYIPANGRSNTGASTALPPTNRSVRHDHDRHGLTRTVFSAGTAYAPVNQRPQMSRSVLAVPMAPTTTVTQPVFGAPASTLTPTVYSAGTAYVPANNTHVSGPRLPTPTVSHAVHDPSYPNLSVFSAGRQYVPANSSDASRSILPELEAMTISVASLMLHDPPVREASIVQRRGQHCNIVLYVHGFLGSEGSFNSFPEDLANELHQHGFDSHVFPQFDCNHELDAATLGVCNYLRLLALGHGSDEAVAAAIHDANNIHDPNHVRKHFPFPTAGPSSVERARELQLEPTTKVRVVLVAHSMGGLVVSDVVRVLMDKTHPHHISGLDEAVVPLGVIALDTPFFSLSLDVLTSLGEPARNALRTAQQVSGLVSLALVMKITVMAGAAVGTVFWVRYRNFLKPLLLQSTGTLLQRLQYLMGVGVPFRCFYPEIRSQGGAVHKFISLPDEGVPAEILEHFAPIATTKATPIEAHMHIFDRAVNGDAYESLLKAVVDVIEAWHLEAW
ncbi:hypothetical protein AMAG_08106 [Allomyces macrogynus ATCC 38327]|uniref:DUF676 domain-containing protein n=1 Tax=Allomyces macrogynus (strain ATCC 38327) TaxID=578462 RepID=A0A0L0SKL0_ALLM3|nr:hypothetical protein AMAG_08106 [Allomyces macrogynus ATCC 38327]|eukprot:KNE62930.1 hypothetical protein AMAG_08106 [Allomyces macrogynus ATCC 38327]